MKRNLMLTIMSHCCPKQERVVAVLDESKGLESAEAKISEGGLLFFM
jgi:hypothetical protein